jgi:hypothetical protein
MASLRLTLAVVPDIASLLPRAGPNKPGPKPAPKIRGEDLYGSKHVRSLERHLAVLRTAHPHPNRKLFFDDVAIAYLLAFFTPALRSLRTIEDASQTRPMRDNTSVPRIPRSTLSDANKIFDPALLEPIIEDLRGRIPNLQRADPQLASLTRRILAVDASLFTVSADVAWALQRRYPAGKPKVAVRLNLKWATELGVPECVTVSGDEASEAAVAMKEIEPGCIYVMDRGYISYALLDRMIHAGSDFVLRLKKSINFQALKDRPISDEDRAAGVISDRVGHLIGSARSVPPGTMLRETVLLDPDAPPGSSPIRLLTNLLDAPAGVIGAIYRRRWQIELFFRWLKVHANFEHLISHSRNGITIGFYIAVIGVLLIYVQTQRPVSKYAYNLLSFVAAGQATLDEILPILLERERQSERDRRRLARKRLEKIGK